MKRPTILIYRDKLLSYSETFIKSQGEALRNCSVYYAGARLVRDISLPAEKVLLVLNKGHFWQRPAELAFKIFGFSPQLYRAFDQLRPDLIHAHFGTDGTIMLPLAKSLKIPLIVTFHGFDATIRDEYARRSFYLHRKYLRRRDRLKREASLFIADSQFIKNKLIDTGYPEEKIKVHYVGVDVVQFEPDCRVPREPIVLFVGRLVERKGCHYLIRAMAEVQAVMPHVRLVIIGDGPFRPYLEKCSKELLRNYEFLGVQPSECVKGWLNRAKIFGGPSITADSGNAEAFGIVFAEAQAMGVPVVSFTSGGIPEAVSHCETGFLAPERDWQLLAKYILDLLVDEKLWLRFSKAGRERVLALFNIDSQASKLEEIYRTVLHEGEVKAANYVNPV
jgi:colanic acid/amylovoran biosynthesis glycosyltransferase